MDQKVTQAKKVSEMKNHFFHARQPHAEIFDFCAQQNCILTPLYWGGHYLRITLYTYFISIAKLVSRYFHIITYLLTSGLKMIHVYEVRTYAM